MIGQKKQQGDTEYGFRYATRDQVLIHNMPKESSNHFSPQKTRKALGLAFGLAGESFRNMTAQFGFAACVRQLDA
jgi:hypothetical protein